MGKNDKNKLDKRALDVLLQSESSFEIETKNGDKKQLALYPLQLGKLAMISQRLIDLDLVFDEEETDVVQKMWGICAKMPHKVAEIIAIATLKTKQEIDEQFEERTNELLWSPTMTVQAYTNLLYTIVFQSYYADFTNAIRSVRMLRVNVSQPMKAERIAHMVGEPSGEQ